MERHQLEYFAAIVRHGGYNRAARELNVSQPSLSRAVRNLERELGLTLFHRVGRNVVLSSAGEILLEDARRILRGFRAMRVTADSVAHGVTGRVDVAVTSSSGLEPVTSTVAELRRRYPGILVSTSSAVSAAGVTASVVAGQCEVGLCGHTEPPEGKNLVVTHVRDEQFLLLLPPSDAASDGDATAAGAGPGTAARPGDRDDGDEDGCGEGDGDGEGGGDRHVRREELAGRAYVVTKPSTVARALFDRLSETVGDMTVAAEVGDRSAVVPFVLRGIGAALVPDGWSDLARRSGARVRRLSPVEAVPQWIVHRDEELTPAARLFIETTLSLHAAPPAR